MRLGIFGGTFDPIHYGHLLLAECCREQAQLDQVWFVPNALSPLKQPRRPTPGALRAEMIELAIGGHTGLAVCREEIERGGLSYTVDTLARLHALHPECELFFLLGADALADIGSWKEPARIGELADLVVVRRAGRPAPDFGPLLPWATPERVARWQAHQVQMPQIDLSASDLRGRVARGLSIRYRTPRAVEQFILSQGLYRPDAEPDAV